MIHCDKIIDSINVGILGLDDTLTIHYANRWIAVHSEKDISDIDGKNLLDFFDLNNDQLKSLKRHIKTALALKAPSFFTADSQNYLLPMKNPMTTKSIFEYMQQDITVIPYDLEQKIVTLLIYDQTSLMEEKTKCQHESIELEKAVKTANATIKKLETARNKLLRQKDIIYKQAHYDQLTSLANRTLLHQKMQFLIDNYETSQQKFGVLFIDLDNFKEINDTLGHDVGDMMLVQVAKTLLLSTRKSDTVARFGGDEFIVLLEHIETEETLKTIVSKLIRNFQHPIRVRNLDLTVTASIGISYFPEHGTTFNKLIKNADLALYKAKAAGRNTYRFANRP